MRTKAPAENGQHLHLRIRVEPAPRSERRLLTIWTQDTKDNTEPQFLRSSRRHDPHFLIDLTPQTIILANTDGRTQPSYLMGEVFRIEQHGNQWLINGARINKGLEHVPYPIGGRTLIFDIVPARSAAAGRYRQAREPRRSLRQ